MPTLRARRGKLRWLASITGVVIVAAAFGLAVGSVAGAAIGAILSVAAQARFR